MAIKTSLLGSSRSIVTDSLQSCQVEILNRREISLSIERDGPNNDVVLMAMALLVQYYDIQGRGGPLEDNLDTPKSGSVHCIIYSELVGVTTLDSLARYFLRCMLQLCENIYVCLAPGKPTRPQHIM